MADEKNGFFKKFINEFKDFALKGNVVDMAVGVVIGSTFSNIVTSLTDNFINPLIAVVTGGAKKDENGVMQVVGGSFKINGISFNYGAFISSVINFLVIAFVLFLMVKAVNSAMNLGKKKDTEPAPAPTTKKCPYCMSEIPIEAKRCPHCTSQLEEAEKPEKEREKVTV